MIDRMHPQQARFLEQLYHDNFDLLTMYAAASLKSRSRAQDVVQDTFHEAVRHIDTLTEHPDPGGWLMVTLKNKLREAERAQRLYLLHFLSLDTDLPVEPRGQDPQPEDRLDEDGPPVLETIRRVLEPDEYRLLTRLTLDRASHLEVAKEFGISVYASQKRLERIRKKLYRVFPCRK